MRGARHPWLVREEHGNPAVVRIDRRERPQPPVAGPRHDFDPQRGCRRDLDALENIDRYLGGQVLPRRSIVFQGHDGLGDWDGGLAAFIVIPHHNLLVLRRIEVVNPERNACVRLANRQSRELNCRIRQIALPDDWKLRSTRFRGELIVKPETERELRQRFPLEPEKQSRKLATRGFCHAELLFGQG